MVMFAVKREVLEALLRDPEWTAKMEKAEKSEEVEKVVIDFCRVKGYKVIQA